MNTEANECQYPKKQQVETPKEDGQSIGEFLLQRLRKLSATSAVPTQIDAETGDSMAFSELLQETVRNALAWRAAGLCQGDTIALFSLDEVLPAFLGAILEGITVVCLEPTWREDEVKRAFSIVSPSVVLSDRDRLPIARAASRADTTHLLSSSGENNIQGTNFNSFLQRHIKEEVDQYTAANIKDLRGHVSLIMFTSGSTGLPKAVALSNYSAYMGFLQPRAWPYLGCYTGERYLVRKSMTWSANVIATLGCVAAGTTRITSKDRDEESTLRVLLNHKVHMGYLVTSQLLRLAALMRRLKLEGRRPDLSFVRGMLCGGAPLSAQSQRAAMEDLGFPVIQDWGSTEVAVATRDDSPPCFGSVGKPLPWVDIKLIDTNTGDEIKTSGITGEVIMKTPGLMKCYLNDERATKEAIDDNGYFHIGDIAYKDEEGRIFIIDRAKNIFKYDCYQVSPAEIEGILMEQPGVMEACVGPRPHEWLGGVPTALVVKSPGATVAAHQLQQAVQDRLSDVKRLRGGVIFVNSIPKTKTGKPDRSAVKAMLKAMPFDRAPEPEVNK